MFRSLRRHNFFLFWLCTLLTFGVGHSQNYFIDYQELVSGSSADTIEETIDSIIHQAQTDKFPLEAINIAHHYSIACYKKKKYDLAIRYGEIEIGIYEANHLINEDYLQVLYNVGRFNYRINDYEASIKLHKKAIDLDFNAATTGRSYFEVGNCYFDLGDYYKAVDHFKIGILNLEQSDNPRLLIRRSLDLSNRYEQINTTESLEEKRKVLERILVLSDGMEMSNRDYYALYNSLASYYNNPETFSFNKSKLYQLQFLNRALKAQDSSHAARSYANLGNLYEEVKNDSAIYYFKKALNLHGSEDDIIRTYNNLSHYYLIKGCWSDALETAHKTFQKTANVSTNSNQLPSIVELSTAADKFSVLRAFGLKATAYIKLFEESNDGRYMRMAMDHLLLADKVIDLLQIESGEEQSKLFWREQAASLYTKAIYSAYQLEQNDLAFYFNEKNKALLLTEGIIINSEKASLPQEVVASELELKKNILALEHNYSEVSMKDPNSGAIQKELFQAKLEFDNYKDSLSILYPKHFSDQQKTALFSLKEVQKKLNDNTIIVSYVWDTTHEFVTVLYAIFIDKNGMEITPVGKGRQLQAQLKQYRNLISKPFEKTDDLKHFRAVAHALYLKLFPSEELRDRIQNKELLIVPDGDLQNIPFEALITKSGTSEFLIKSNEIRYAYSMSFLLQNSGLVRNGNERFIGFSPSTFPNTELPDLTHTASELAAIQELTGGEKFEYSFAKKNNFLKKGSNAKIIHLATHADAGRHPWIAFSDAKLEVHELYTFKNQADLVVLSACNTSTGELAQGEGVLSLARGFFYSGASSVIATLWNANDKATAIIMEDFYSQLMRGETKSKALHGAKLNYINSHSLSDASPYYWASFVLIGDGEAIPFANGYSNWWVSAVLLLLVILAYFFFSKIRAKTFR